MNKIRIGILGCADIAKRLMAPSIIRNDKFILGGVASRDIQKANAFSQEFRCTVFDNYDLLIESDHIDAVYIPLPPALHFEWAKKAICKGKHILIEKPITTNLSDTKTLVHIANNRCVTIFENYMFEYHSQITYIKELIEKNEIGEIRLVRSSFGFPLKKKDDFRYDKALGGGSLLDCGGYPVKLAQILFGQKIEVVHSQLNYQNGFEVDMYGNGVLVNEKGQVCQIAYGFDSFYQCNCEIWGQTGKITTTRIFTAPPDLSPVIKMEKQNRKLEIELPADNHCNNILNAFYDTIKRHDKSIKVSEEIVNQSKLIEDIRSYADNNRRSNYDQI